MGEPKIIDCGHCRSRRRGKSKRGIVSMGVAPPPDDIMARLRRAYDETGNSLLRDAMEAIAAAHRDAH